MKKVQTKKILVIIAILVTALLMIGVAAAGLLYLIGFNIFNVNDDFSVYEEKGEYILQDYHENLDGTEMIGFVITDKQGQELYRSELICRAWNLKHIFFDQDCNVIVASGDIGAVTYLFDGETWGRN